MVTHNIIHLSDAGEARACLAAVMKSDGYFAAKPLVPPKESDS